MNPTARALASCIVRAGIATGANPRYAMRDNHVYWHTREAASMLAAKSGIPWGSVIGVLQEYNQISSWKDESGELWAELAHPDLLAREVMES